MPGRDGRGRPRPVPGTAGRGMRGWKMTTVKGRRRERQLADARLEIGDSAVAALCSLCQLPPWHTSLVDTPPRKCSFGLDSSAVAAAARSCADGGEWQYGCVSWGSRLCIKPRPRGSASEAGMCRVRCGGFKLETSKEWGGGRAIRWDHLRHLAANCVRTNVCPSMRAQDICLLHSFASGADADR